MADSYRKSAALLATPATTASVSADPKDRRGRRLGLTPAGGTLLAQAVPIWERAHAELEARLPLGEPDRLRADLRALA